jgi:hypothetical protein
VLNTRLAFKRPTEGPVRLAPAVQRLAGVNIRFSAHDAHHLTERLRAFRRSIHMRLAGSGSARVMLIPAVLVLLGCSISTSVQSSSDSSTSSESSSRSSASSSRSSTSSSEGRQSRYRDDVRSYTAAYARSGAQLDVFERELSEVARSHGLTNWEEDEATYIGIGAGLGDAAVSKDQLEMYKAGLSRSDPFKMQAIQRGYDTRE